MKIVIIGNSGSGKTYLAKHLANAISAPLIHLDELFWDDNGFDKKRPHEEVSKLIENSFENGSWIVEGVFGSLAERYLPLSDLLIWLDIDWEVCKQRLIQRGTESHHMGRAQSELSLQKLINWASTYQVRSDDCSCQGHQALFSRFNGLGFHLRHESDIVNFLAGRMTISEADCAFTFNSASK